MNIPTKSRLLAGLLIAANLMLFVLMQRSNPDLQKGDFKMFYTAAVALRSGSAAAIYSRALHIKMQRELLPQLPMEYVKSYTHPPYELLVFLPLSFFSHKAACYLWMTITVMLAVLCGRLLASYVAVMGMFPFLIVLSEQQDSVLALLILIGCWLALRRDRDALAGFILGLALFKFQIVIPLAVVLFFWRPRLFRGFLLSGVVVSLLSVTMVGPEGILSYVRYLYGMAHSSTSAVSGYYLMDPRTNPTLRGLLYYLASGGGESVYPFAGRLLPFALAVLNLTAFVIAWKFMRSAARAEVKFAFAVLVALILSFHLLPHDLILLALPFVLLRNAAARWPIMAFYSGPLILIFLYPHSQAWLAVLLIASCSLIRFPRFDRWLQNSLYRMPGDNAVGQTGLEGVA